MMAKQRQLQALKGQPVNRPGEGTAAINVALKTFIATDGQSISQLGLDLSQAHVPDRRYAADTCAVTYSNQVVRLIFGQELFNGAGLRSAVAVKMTPRAVMQLLQMIDSSMSESFVQGLALEGVQTEALASPIVEPSQTTVVLAANLVLPAVSSLEACIDFYQASAFALGVAMRSSVGKLAVDAVVRVDLSTGLFLALLEELRRISPQFANVKIWSPATT